MTAYEQGGEAYSKGVSEDDNPYLWGTEEYNQWWRGWHILGKGGYATHTP